MQASTRGALYIIVYWGMEAANNISWYDSEIPVFDDIYVSYTGKFVYFYLIVSVTTNMPSVIVKSTLRL